MNSFVFSAKRLLGAVALILGVGLTAPAQTITLNGSAAAATAAQVGGGGLQYACTPYSPASPSSNLQTLVFTPGPANEVVDKWTLLGDGTAGLSGGNTFNFYPTGFGKARVVVSYFYTSGSTPVYCPNSEIQVTCDGKGLTTPIRSYATRTFDFFKVFTQAQANIVIKGPTCVPANNPSVVYSVDPAVISQVSQIQGGLGTDDYTWTVNYVNGLVLTPTITGDGSAIIIRGQNDPGGPSQLTGSYNVSVKVGKCNAFSPPKLVTVASDINSTATPAVVGFPSCLPTSAPNTTTFTLNTVAGVNYTLSSNGGGISISPPSIAGNGSPATITLANITATNSAVVSIVGTATGTSCFGTQSFVQAINRQLVIGQNGITPTCVPPNATGVVLTLANAPAGTTWSVPAGSGWTITSQNGGTATVNTSAASTSVTTTGSCGTSIAQPISVAGAVAGCSYYLKQVTGSPHLYQALPTAGNSCPLPGTTYVFTLANSAGTVLETSSQLADPVNYYPFNTGSGTTWPSPGYTVRVRVRNNGNCLDVNATPLTNQLRPAAGGSTAPAAAKAAVGAAHVYPNPSNDVVNIELPEAAKGVAEVTIIDVLGRVQKALTTTARWTPVSVAKLPAGTYTVRVVLADGTKTAQTLLVNH